MAAPTREEIAQKLAELQTQSRAFDRYRACMRSTSGEQSIVSHTSRQEDFCCGTAGSNASSS